MGSTAGASGFENGSPTGPESRRLGPSDAGQKRSGENRVGDGGSSGRGTTPGEKDLGKEELKAKLQRQQWGSRLGVLIRLLLFAMNLYIAYLILSMVT